MNTQDKKQLTIFAHKVIYNSDNPTQRILRDGKFGKPSYGLSNKPIKNFHNVLVQKFELQEDIDIFLTEFNYYSPAFLRLFLEHQIKSGFNYVDEFYFYFGFS